MNDKPFRPLLACKVEPDQFEKLNFPMIASPKIDGIRCLIKDGVPVSRKLKPIPNDFIRENLTGEERRLAGLDGELVTFTDGELDDFNTIQSKVMSSDGSPDFRFLVFDNFNDPGDYYSRLRNIWHANDAPAFHPYVEALEYMIVNSIEELSRIEAKWCADGHEGVMLRSPTGIYKQGRSTFNQQILLKLKRFDDDEAVLVGMTEMMHNNNEAEKDELGHTKRSHAKAGMRPAGVMGNLILEWRGTQFEIGTGFTAEQRADYWLRREELKGSIVTFRYQGVGSKGRPRFPSFAGFRPEMEAA